jgi:hypothetical protein
MLKSSEKGNLTFMAILADEDDPTKSKAPTNRRNGSI